MNAKLTMILGAAAVIVGSFLPWASMTAPFVGTVTVTGLQGDGIITIVVGGLLLLDALGRKERPGKDAGGLRVLLGIACVLFTGYELLNAVGVVGEISGGEYVASSIGAGIPVMLIGALAYTVGAGTKAPAPAAPPVAAPEEPAV